MQAIAKRKSHLAGCGWFWAWALVGVGFGLGISVVGIFTVPLALVAVVFLSRRQPVRGACGVATGAGSVLLFVAYINRSGDDGSFNPVPWLIAGVVLFTAGLVGHAWTSAPSD
jgi:hypothetical protein